MNLGDLKNRGDTWPELVSNLRYTTPPGQAGWAARHLPGWATVQYHFKVCSIIRGVARVAVEGRFGTAEFAGCCRNIFRAAESCGGMIEIEGVEHVRDSVPAVFVANHMGSFETLVVAAFILPFGDATFVLKESLMSYPIMKHLIRGIHPVAVGRTNPREDLKAVMDGGVDRLKAGVSVVVFPQATRSPEFDMSKFNTLGVKLAGRAGVPLVPLAVKTDFVATGKVFKDFGKVDVSLPAKFRFGPPARVSSRAKEDHRKATEFIAGCLDEWGMPVVRTSGSETVE